MKKHPIRLPEDMCPHNSIVEWWYFNGRLSDARGNEYSFMDCLFRVDVARVKIPFLGGFLPHLKSGKFLAFSHSVITDIKKKKNYKDIQYVSLLSRDSFSRPLFFVNYVNALEGVGNFAVNEIAESKMGTFHIKTERMDLVLESQKPIMLEGGKGFITVCGNESFYYSHTRLKTSGMIKVGDEWIPVNGLSWMDRQWADVAFEEGHRWTWFSVQLENGTDVMCVEYGKGNRNDYIVDVLDKSGNTKNYLKATFTHDKLKQKSRKTKAEYPLHWNVSVPDEHMNLDITSVLSDQEMVFGSINYFEGPVRVVATINGKKIKGVGFMELVGYPSDYNFLLLAGNELRSKLEKNISSSLRQLFT